MLTPVFLLVNLFTGLFSIGLVLAAVALLRRATHPRPRFVEVHDAARVQPPAPAAGEPRAQNREVSWRERWREPAILAPLLAGAALLLFSFGLGRPLVLMFLPGSNDEPMPLHGESHDVMRPDRTRIHVETFGPEGAPTIVFSHGWGTNTDEWYYAKKQLGGQFRLVMWDLPGLGQTAGFADGDFALNHMASDLRLVLGAAGGKPVVLVGHSIGGMINLTFARQYPEMLGKEVRGIVQLDTSYTNPVKTAQHSSLNQALQKPVAEPVLHLMIWLSPVVRAMNWLSYQNGTSVLMNHFSSFAGTETRGQLDMTSRFQYQESPGVIARGTLGMFHWDATPVLEEIHIPVLILVGDKDGTTVPAASEFMHRHIEGSEMQVLGPGNHYTLLEQNQKTDAAIGSFAGKVLK